MESEHLFRVASPAASVREGIRLFFLGGGYVDAGSVDADDAGDRHCIFRRGSRVGRWFSGRPEAWPTVIQVTIFSSAPAETGVLARMTIFSGMHLVGSLDWATIEAELLGLEEYLASGQRSPVAQALDAARRPVVLAATLNMVIAAVLVAFVGVLGGYSLPWVFAAATGIALLDGIVILAFADLVAAGSKNLHEEMFRLRERGR